MAETSAEAGSGTWLKGNGTSADRLMDNAKKFLVGIISLLGIIACRVNKTLPFDKTSTVVTPL